MKPNWKSINELCPECGDPIQVLKAELENGIQEIAERCKSCGWVRGTTVLKAMINEDSNN